MTTPATRPAARHERDISQRELIVLMALLMSLQAFGIDSMLPALGVMGGELGATGNERQFVISAYFLGSGIGAFFPGAFADRFGRRPVLFVGLVSYVVMSLACALVTDFTTLLVLRLVQGIACAGLSVVPTAIVRDKVGGDRMASMMSLIIMIFLAVPIFAPAIGQLILLVADWRAIFGAMAVAGTLVMLWVWWRLPESLTAENVQDLDARTILKNMGEALSNRVAVGYVVGSALVFGSLFGFLNSSQQLIEESFGAGNYFALIFGASVFGMVIASFTNSRIVERFGARRVSHTALLVFLVVAVLQMISAGRGGQTLWEFVPLLALSMTMLGFVGANFSSIAMQPFQHIAGAASSAQTSVRMVTGAVLGALIGQAYDGSAFPLGVAMTLCAVTALVLVLYSERGKLFRRPGEAHKYMIVHDILRN
ncbi:multidrug effflux MFS transporter [Altererythrobacter sp. H2]|uniref:multidrug effflux MFS transporter n=1 Tax=Altererythrobacter sp. H2 TaxID=3108391 RepID=UPI000BC7D64A|nr:multidrug effflux MFS transporter [Altererythrobacter sp. H2]OZA93675.1 MAG: Bcr/CflA subfamily drug resistance transporter [Erythrobacter sp. 34-65-8]WRK95501.1 multidrug effflux MFS transporter [Altererythrobacter sp. H2]